MLHDLDDGFDFHPELCPRGLVFCRTGARVVDGEHAAVTDVRVVRDREDVAARAAIPATLLQQIPQFPLPLNVQVACGLNRNHFVLEDHVAVQVRAQAKRTVFVRHESCPFATVTRIVPILRSIDRALPTRSNFFTTARSVSAAHFVVSPVDWAHDVKGKLLRAAASLAERFTKIGVVDARRLIGAQINLTQKLCVIGDRHKVERPIDAHFAGRLSLGVIGREHQRSSERIAIGVVGEHPHLEHPSVTRDRCMNVQVTKVCIAKWVSVRARGFGNRRGCARCNSERPLGRRGLTASQRKHHQDHCEGARKVFLLCSTRLAQVQHPRLPYPCVRTEPESLPERVASIRDKWDRITAA